MRKPWGVLLLFLVAMVSFAQDDFACTDCHDQDGEPAINMEAYAQSIHGDMACIDCHEGADTDFDEHPMNLQPVSCTMCHEDVEEEHKTSLHAELTCWQCHWNIHELDMENPVSGNADLIVAMCSRCHAEPDELGASAGKACPNLDQFKHLPPQHSIIEHYTNSAHYLKKDEDGNAVATCSSCHGSHAMKRQNDPDSPVHRLNLSKTCGECHGTIQEEYEISVHGQAVFRGWDESPTCTCCHNSHFIKSTDSPEALTGKLKVSEDICLSCHEDKRLIERYGLDDYIGSTYRDSYHSMAGAMGSEEAATCVDCHTTHKIMRSEDPESTTHYTQITNTCSNCHEGADETFAASYDHKSSLKTGNIINYYVKQAYIWLILLVIGGMLLHNFLYWLGAVIRSWRHRKTESFIQRMTRGQIVLHTINLLAFFTLVITGFSLRFSHMEVFSWLTFWLSEGARSLIHRIAGVVMIGLFLAHVIRIIMGKADRRAFIAMLPRPKDIRDFKQNLNFMLARTDERPRFGKTTYMEKMEYLALMWGTVVMILTGLVLWFPELTAQIFPGWSIKVSETIHYFEAILATLAIFVWHFFFVIFNPDIYPLDMTFLDGKMPVEEIKHLRPDWYDELKKAGKIKE